MTAVGAPPNLELPFFAYGIFKSGELAWPRIKDHVVTVKSARLTDWVIRLRNGLPVLIAQPAGSVQGDCVSFRNPSEGYAAVGESEPSSEYEWRTLRTEAGAHCNVLIAVKPNRGVSDEQIDSWTSADDPSFVHGMAAVKKEVTEVRARLIERRPWLDTPADWDAFFRLQGAFLVLWSIIERLASFRFGTESVPPGRSPTTIGRICQLADVVEFQNAMRKAEPRSQTVFSVRENRPKRTSSSGKVEDSVRTTEKNLKAWYQIRSNITHRGKSAPSDNKTVLDATIDLFNTTYHYLDSVVPSMKSRWETRDVCVLLRDIDECNE